MFSDLKHTFYRFLGVEDDYSQLSPAHQILFRKYPFPSKSAIRLTDKEWESLTGEEVKMIKERDAAAMKHVRNTGAKNYKKRPKCSQNAQYATAFLLVAAVVYVLS